MKNIGLFTKTAGAALVLAAGLMVGCGSDGGSSVKKGTFEDAAVIGISFKTATQEGVTDEKGTFKFKKGESVTFFIAGVELPSGIPQGNVITPAHLAGTADWENDVVAVNIIQFLLSLDSDLDTDGIQIPDGLAEYLEEVEFTIDDWADSSFDSNLDELIDDINLELDLTLVVVDETEAKAHFNATIEALGIDIEIQISTEAQACNSINTGDIRGTWAGSLTESLGDPSYTGSQTIVVEGTSLRIGKDSIGGSCTYAHSEVSGDVELVTDTWIWTNGTDTYSLITTESIVTSTTFTVTESNGTAVSSGTISRPE